MQVIPYPHENPLCEAFQSNDLQFSFVNPSGDNFQMVHPWIKCREYFNELLMLNYHPTEFKYTPVYGFNYLQKDFPLDLSETRIALKFAKLEQKTNFLKHLPFLHQLEDINLTDHTQVFESDKKHVVVLVASKLWIQKCLLLNVYSLVLKLMTLDVLDKPYNTWNKVLEKFNQKPTEITYVDRIKPQGLNNILENCTTIAQVPTIYVDGTDKVRTPYEVHEKSGLLTVHYHINKLTDTMSLENFCQGIKEIFHATPKYNLIKT